jgi:hypothetical protein
MSNYDLSKLNDKEFEVLVIDLLSKHLGKRIERFKPGKDKGVDGRFFLSKSTEAILQVKHWEGSMYKALLSHLRKSELPKINRLNPAKYIFATSVPLSRLNKQQILSALSPHVKYENDIYGHEDIQQLLDTYPQIARQNYKLWLTSAEILSTIFNAAIIGRSLHKIEEASDFLKKYVITPCHVQAVKRLKKLGSIIIVGEPGIGKTILAEQVVLNYVALGYELCVIENSLNEAEDVWSQDKKQIFYFDDFLGRNYLEALTRHEDSHILSFIKRVQKNKTKLFILTSRTTILNQGKHLSELFRAENIDRAEFEIKVADFTTLDKAKILYNHIWFPPSRT